MFRTGARTRGGGDGVEPRDEFEFELELTAVPACDELEWTKPRRGPLDLDLAARVQGAPAEADARVEPRTPEGVRAVEVQHVTLRQRDRGDGKHVGKDEGEGRGEAEAHDVEHEDDVKQPARAPQEVAVVRLGQELVVVQDINNPKPYHVHDAYQTEEDSGRVPGLDLGVPAHPERSGEGLHIHQCDHEAEHLQGGEGYD
ncbi:hypothetical protein PG996_004955 [Apiospora saccharicola]|uniref:Uncharacterized protein n=1 Tax=Apiospora saccharicola TaxID=335842 RepID=A0ABR1VKE4_9PEZI